MVLFFFSAKILPQNCMDLVKPDPGLTQSKPEPIVYRCRKCRRIVAAKSNLMNFWIFLWIYMMFSYEYITSLIYKRQLTHPYSSNNSKWTQTRWHKACYISSWHTCYERELLGWIKNWYKIVARQNEYTLFEFE